MTQQIDSVDTVAACGVLLARLKLVQGDVASATALLAKAEQFVHQHNFVFRMPEVTAAQVLTLLRQGSLSAAAHLAHLHDLPISLARVHLAQETPPQHWRGLCHCANRQRQWGGRMNSSR